MSGGLHICRLKRTTVCFPLLFSADLNFALYKYKYRILIPFCLLNHPSRRPVLTRGAASYPPGLAALSCALTSLRGLRFAWSPLAIASRRPRLAPNPGYCLPARSAAPLSPPPPLLLPAVCPALSPPTAALSSLLLPDGLASSEPRSVRADGIPGSERSAATATRQRGGRSASRRPGGGERRPPFGRAAERARSAARASPGHPPAHSAPTPLRLILYLHRSILYPRRPLSSLLLPDGLASSEPRSVRADVIPGSERHAAHRHASAGRWSAPRRPGERSALTPFGRAAEPARSAARASPGHPPAHSAPTPLRLILYLHRSILYPRRPLSSLLLPDGLASSEPRSVRADVIPGSERHAAHRHASAGWWSAPRRPGGEERAHPGRPSCGACEVSRPRQPGLPRCR